MSTTLASAITKYVAAGNLARGTKDEYQTTLRKWTDWGGGVPIEDLSRRDIREFLDWVHERAVANEGTNPGRTAKKAREHLHAVMSWAWEQEIVKGFHDSRNRRHSATLQADMPESAVEILGHSVAGITYRHYAHRAPLVFKAIMSLPQPSAFWTPVRGHDGQCPCCRRAFADAS